MEILIKALVISLFCVGLRVISSPGMILYFLRQPFDRLKERKAGIEHDMKNWNKQRVSAERTLNRIKHDDTFDKEHYKEVVQRTRICLAMCESPTKYDWLLYIMKPVILCSTCMASFWTIAIELGYYNTFSLQSVIIAFVVAALNSIIHASYERLSR